MLNEALNGRVPLGHENPQVVKISVSGVNAGEVGKAVQACQVLHSSSHLPEVPTDNGHVSS